jgi:hypothetical protein
MKRRTQPHDLIWPGTTEYFKIGTLEPQVTRGGHWSKLSSLQRWLALGRFSPRTLSARHELQRAVSFRPRVDGALRLP